MASQLAVVAQMLSRGNDHPCGNHGGRQALVLARRHETSNGEFRGGES
jgi:hypothetical protein